MEKFKKMIAIIMALALCSFAGCVDIGLSSSSSSEGSAPPVVDGEEPWLGNWERPDMPDDPIEEIRFCEHQCYECGKCVSLYSEEEECAEKCYDEKGRTLYAFNATDDHVDRKGGVNIEGDHVGNINLNPNVVITYHVTAAEEATVCLGATISEMPIDHYVTADTPIYINGEQYYSRGYLQGGASSWTNFYTVWLGCVTLQKGDNEILFTNPHSSGQQYNFKDFSFLSSVELTWTEIEEHVCSSKNGEGKCTDYTCNERDCLNKDETGWNQLVIQGGDDKVLKYYLDGDGVEHSLWNKKEGCIGNIASSIITGIYNQTIVFSFEATEETYVRLSLNTSTSTPGTEFAEMYAMTLNGEEIVTSGCSGTAANGGWATYVDGTVAYVKVKPGVNTFLLVHKATNAGDNIKYLTISYASGSLTAVQAEKPENN